MYRLSPNFIVDDIGSQVYLRPVDLESDIVILLNDSSQFIIQLVVGGTTSLNEIAAQLAAKYGLCLAQATEDVCEFLTPLVRASIMDEF